MDMNETVGNFSVNESFADNCSYFVASGEAITSLSKAAEMIDLIIPPVMLLIGIPGNILTMIIVMRQRRNITSTATYLFMLAVADTTFLLIGTFVDWVHTISGLNLRETNIVVCKISNFLYYSSAQFSSWILVAITIERIISITMPHKYRQLCTRMVSIMSGLVICCAVLAINTHFLIGFGLSDAYIYFYGSKCGPLPNVLTYEGFYFDIWPWVDFTILFAVPFVVLSVGNSIILFKLYRVNSTMQAKKDKGDNDKKNRKSIRSITLLIVGLNVVFLVCITPLSLFLTSENALYEWADEFMCIDQEIYEYRRGVIHLIVSVVICLSYINPSINFVLYVLSGTKFRNEVKALLLCKPVGAEHVFA